MKRIALPIALLCAGCTVGPDYKKPDVAVPASFREAPNAASASDADLAQWWMQFNDPELQSLVIRALKSNLDLQTAASRVREAREQEIIEGAAGLPHVNASGNHLHFHSNGDPLAGLTGQPPAPGGTDVKLYNVGFDATWEIDIFGGVRRSVEQAQADTEAAVWQMHDGEVSLTAEIATDYLELRTLQARLSILADEEKRERDTLSLVSARAQAGFVTQLDVNQQISQAESTAAQIPPLQAQMRASEHAIAILLGGLPDALAKELETTPPPPATPTILPPGLPSDLLRRRPDVREAERKLAAATAGIGVAVADLYPKFNLLGGASFTSNRLDNLLSTSNLGELGLLQITWPIFQGGKIYANINAKKEETTQAYLAYQKSVLGAIKDAEDALTREATDIQRVQALDRAARSAQSSALIARQQYAAGFVTYINVLQTQATDLSTRDQLAQGQLALATDLVSLYKALGGGWQDADKTAPSK
ncbi:MAG TPA: efflux transporter outer membrane subunit [Rhizomicrobium sp.]|nr:efflux transporter outer membrane subunit [Rhizomicrobium sp.]